MLKDLMKVDIDMCGETVSTSFEMEGGEPVKLFINDNDYSSLLDDAPAIKLAIIDYVDNLEGELH